VRPALASCVGGRTPELAQARLRLGEREGLEDVPQPGEPADGGVDARRPRPLDEPDRVVEEDLVGADVDEHRRQAGQVAVER
jgi:hypothetical protein